MPLAVPDATPRSSVGIRLRAAWRSSAGAADRFQQHHAVVGFPVAVAKKFADDRAGHLAATVAFFGFFSLFPLLLVLVTVLGFVLEGNAELRSDLVDAAASQFPVVGADIADGLEALSGSAPVLAAGIAGALWGALRAVNAAREALDDIWGIPEDDRPGFFAARAKGLVMIAVLGGGLIAGAAVNNLAEFLGSVPAVARVALHGGSLAVNIAVVALSFKVLADWSVAWRRVLPGALFSGTMYWALQLVGVAVVRYVIGDAQAAFGAFAVVLGLLTWLFLQMQVTMLGAEINAVRDSGAWPIQLLDTSDREPGPSR